MERPDIRLLVISGEKKILPAQEQTFKTTSYPKVEEAIGQPAAIAPLPQRKVLSSWGASHRLRLPPCAVTLLVAARCWQPPAISE